MDNIYHKAAVILYILMLIIGGLMIAVAIIAIPVDDNKNIHKKNKRNKGSENNLEKLKSYIYRYTDIITGEIVYVGIVYAGHSLRTRIRKELKDFDWIQDRLLTIEYQMLEVSQTDLQALEAHLINKYGAIYNTQKATWGESQYIKIDESKWEDYDYRNIKEIERLRAEVKRLQNKAISA